jgi:hypothetical protein
METDSHFVRFVVPVEGAHTRRATGMFQVCTLYPVRALGPRVDRRVRESFDWFDEFLPVPPVVKTRREALSWFRREPAGAHEAAAREPLRRAFLLATYLRASGIGVETVQTNVPGDVLYEDRWQIVAVPRGATATGNVLASETYWANRRC